MTTISMPAAGFAAALDAVRFAAGSDPALPMLSSVLCETGSLGDVVTLVATDRYRLAVARTTAEVDGPPVRALLPAPLVDAARALLTGDDQVTVTLDDGRMIVETGGRRVEGSPLEDTFPDHRRLVPAGDVNRQVTVDVAELRAAVGAGPVVWRENEGSAYPVAILQVSPTGAVCVTDEDVWAAQEAASVAVNREFLLEALDAGGAGQLLLELDGPIKPLAVRRADDPHRFSILMPVRR